MLRRLAIYIAAFLAAFTVWLFFAVLEALNPFLPWQIPLLIPFTGISFPGGATPTLHYANHVLETWFPFLVAYFVAFWLTQRQASFLWSFLNYVAFLAWSAVMVLLDQRGLPLETIFFVGMLGTFFGGAALFYFAIYPSRPKQPRYIARIGKPRDKE